MNSKSKDQGGKKRRSKEGTKMPLTNLLGLTGCTESKASGWILESLDNDLERICWKRRLEKKHLAPFCVEKRILRFRL